MRNTVIAIDEGARFTEGRDAVARVKRNLVAEAGMRQFLGTAPTFLATLAKIPRVAACDAAVLLVGETGTGKEMCARAIHHLSARAAGPFVAVNCGSIPAELFENELFGHESGAYTDARQPQRGLIAEAEGGTLFLDEVEALPLSAQVKLLRFLQDRQYKPLGGSRARQANTRVLAASNEDLEDRVRDRTFREDLYYRLKVISLWLPPLRDRATDIAPLALHFVKLAAREYGRPDMPLIHEATEKLRGHGWPGNVRELENVIRQAVVLSNGPTIRAADIELSRARHSGAPEPEGPAPVTESLKTAKARMVESFERAYLQDVLAASDGNISRAARQACKNRRAFFALLKKYGLTSLRPTVVLAAAS